ncbi:hypothetical protein LSUE1_G004523 [Lachnellula suecica]|uniref:Uncharacterized protein n=1 Tax=Lachnellula suecica TaxID=602035 RepID=A0A8T9C6B7_9HELO|nr:hypothetical protein LSUE1_G004523 [Lachnellula suecica]
MEIPYDSSNPIALKSHEEILIGVLSKLSPADVTKSKELKTCFRKFFGRGTTEDYLQLFPPHRAVLPDLHHQNVLSSLRIVLPKLPSNPVHSIPLNSPSSCGTSEDASLSAAAVSVFSPNTPVSKALSPCSSSNLIPPITTSPCANALTSIAQPQPTADASLLDSGNPAVKYFREKSIHTDRINRLNRLIQSFASAKALPLQSYENLWSSKGTIFAGFEQGLSRTCRLRRGRQKIEEGKIELGCAGRFCLMFSVHDVAHYSQTTTRKDLGLSVGRKRMTAALEKFVKANKISKEDFHEDKRRSRNFFEWVFLAGPGFLLEMGPDAGCWEKNTNTKDVQLVLEFMEAHLPIQYQRAKSLNGVGARAIVVGLLAYGWNFGEVKSSPTPFLKAVRKHLDENLEVPSTKDHTKRKRVEEHHTSDQSPFAFDSQTTETCPLPGDTGIENQRPRSCSPITTSSNTPSEVTFNDVGQSTMPNDSAINILADVTTSNAAGNIGNGSIAQYMTDQQIGILRPTPSTDLWLESNFNCAKNLDASDPGSGEVASMDTSRLSSALNSNSTQDMPVVDASMLNSLGKARCLPSSLELDSSQELTVDPNMLMIDTSMLSSLGKARCLPNVQDSEANQEGMFMMNPNMMSNLSATRMVPQFLGVGTGNVFLAQKDSSNGLGGMGQLQNGTSTHPGIMV